MGRSVNCSTDFLECYLLP